MNCATELLPHQIPAVEKLVGLRVGALLMDMGLGKSRTAIELVRRRAEKISRVIWLCPVSLMETIAYEIEKHVAPGDHSSVYAFDEKTHPDRLPSTFWYVVGIQSMSTSNRVILSVRGLIDDAACVIVDESSFIKGHDSNRTWWITEFAKVARYRLILNGTPISQGVVDLYAQYRFLSPKILGYRSFYSFAANHLEYSDRYPGMIVRGLNVEVLAHKIAPYTYQVSKGECLNLPDKLYETWHFSMTPEQEARYEQAKWELLGRFEDMEEMPTLAILKLFTALQQITSGFWNRRELPTSRRERNPLELMKFPHRRLETLLNVIAQIPSEERIIIWAKYELDIMGIQESLREAHGEGAVSLFYGKNAATRHKDVSRWREGSSRFLVANPASGGHGLTLNEACWVIFYNNGFKYSERIQAEDRCHRIGQERPATYIDLICRNSIDSRIQSALANKKDVVRAFKYEVAAINNKKQLASVLNDL